MADEQPSGPLSDEDVEYLQNTIIQIGCEFVFYGAHICCVYSICLADTAQASTQRSSSSPRTS